MGVLAIEMESAALYATAVRAGKKALSLLTVSDNIVTKEETSGEVRQTAFTHMMDVAFSLI
jgi:purine-nucleoside phosphorylase